MMERIEKMTVSDDALELVFRKARTYNAWLPKPVPEELLRQLSDTLKFYDKVPRLFPHYPAMRDMFVNNPQLIQETALRNSTLQGAYMILAARALGLDCGPMSGFDNAKLDEEFFAAGKCESCEQEFFPEGHVKSNFLCNIGYGDVATLKPRGPRLDFSEACTLL
jgi:3-hydroxypropanoate dehydrogenase